MSAQHFTRYRSGLTAGEEGLTDAVSVLVLGSNFVQPRSGNLNLSLRKNLIWSRG